jgi:hypothetical protein
MRSAMLTTLPVPNGEGELPPTVPQPPAAPPAAQEGAPAIAGAPRLATQASVEALRDMRSELSNQLSSATSRRKEVAKQLLSTPPGPGRAGLEGRLAVLDGRIMKLESTIAETGEQLANADLGSSGTTQPASRYGPFSSGQLTGITIVSIALVWAPLAFAAARIMMRRWAHPRPAPQILESSARLERMEQAIDAVAIEIERISEGQRFVTQAMAKKEAVPALGVGQAPAQELRVGEAERMMRG